MKSLLIFMLSCATVTSVWAQNTFNTVTIQYNGQNRQVLIDGKAYAGVATNNSAAVNTSTAKGYNFSVVTNSLAPGRHVLQLVRNNNRRNVETNFTLRNNYDLAVSIDANGSVQLKETYRKLTGSTGTAAVAMSASNYNLLVQDVKRRTQTAAKLNTLNIAFANTANYFTTAQARKLILLVNGEAFRLQLAKAAVRSITDTRNIYSLTSILAAQASRNELTDYIRNYNTTASPTPTTPTTPTTGMVTAMADASFTQLLNEVRDNWQPGGKMTAVSNAFKSSGNYFTTAQAMQLIQLLSSESERLQLAKASFRTIVDPANFNQVNNLLGTQSSRDDLAAFLRSGGTATYESPAGTTYRVAMSDANFASLVEQIRVQWIPGAKKRDVLNAFATTTNYFTTSQAMQLIQLDNDEPDRFDMAKASYRTIVDPQNFSQVYQLFVTQSYKTELEAYIRSIQ